ncbi:MAG: P-loop NTPase [Desulfatibacillaceae bacterium]|nr:P-loop NTPase [Desulfatibacillaceae bacterium]
MESTTIIPIASGKGGVGKTLLCANLCIALAKLGHSTVAVDLDLGGSNLYTCLGVPNKYPGIGDFLKADGEKSLQELAVPTSVDGLSFIPGDGSSAFTANITHDQRRTLMQGIKSLKQRFVILDLGAGTSFNSLNFFGMAPYGIIITTFETPAIMNAVMFLRNFAFRAVSGMVRPYPAVLADVVERIGRPVAPGEAPITVRGLFDLIARHDQTLAARVEKALARYRPRIVFNMGDSPQELSILDRLDATIRQGLCLEPDFFGFIFYDDIVRQSAKRREVLLLKHPGSAASRGIIGLARKVIGAWDGPLAASGAQLKEQAEQQFEALAARKDQESGAP